MSEGQYQAPKPSAEETEAYEAMETKARTSDKIPGEFEKALEFARFGVMALITKVNGKRQNCIYFSHENAEVDFKYVATPTYEVVVSDSKEENYQKNPPVKLTGTVPAFADVERTPDEIKNAFFKRIAESEVESIIVSDTTSEVPDSPKGYGFAYVTVRDQAGVLWSARIVYSAAQNLYSVSQWSNLGNYKIDPNTPLQINARD